MLDKLIINPKSPKGEDGYKTFSIRIRNDMVDEIEEISYTTGRSRNELIGMLLEFALNNYQIESKTGSDR